jgi:hypothetical protein
MHKGRVVEHGVVADVVARSGAGSLDAAFTGLTAGEPMPR